MNSKLKTIFCKNSEIVRNNIKNKESRNQLHLLFQQFGDANNKLTITYNKHKYIYEETMDKDHYILFSKDNDDCVIVIISKKEKTAEIHGIGNYQSCLIDTNINVDSILLQMTIKMCKKYKDKFNIEMIILTDNSLKKCHDKNIQLSHMLVLLTGDTWYGKYGFRPIMYSNNKYIIDEKLNEKYYKNKHQIDILSISDFDLIKYIKMTKNESMIKATNEIIKQNPQMLLKDYLKNILSDYDKTCKYFNKFYMELYDNLRLYDFHKKIFGLII